MITVKPFRGLQYSKSAGDLSQLICPPYDMISDRTRAALQNRSIHNAVYLESPESYSSAAKLLDEWLQSGVIIQSPDPAFYLYQVSYSAQNRLYNVRGVIGALRLPESSDDYVRTHENTLESPKKDRLELLSGTQCNFSPVFSVYHDPQQTLPPVLDEIATGPPSAQGEQNHLLHSLWQITDPLVIQTISDFFSDKTFYIADGHHRYATACTYRDQLRKRQPIGQDHPAHYVMTLLTDASCPGLTILPIHRALTDLPMFDSDRILKQAEAYFEVAPCQTLEEARSRLLGCKAKRKNAFVFYADRSYHICRLKDPGTLGQFCSQSGAYQSLDVTVLHKLFFDQILHPSQSNIQYITSAAKACKAVDVGDACCAVLLNATRMDQVIAVADQKENMPQKSTYYYPKPITGMVFRSLVQPSAP